MSRPATTPMGAGAAATNRPTDRQHPLAAGMARTDGARLRSDAARNRARILTAAAELFTEYGVEVSMSAIARRAQVGVATLFRRFPDRESLVAEVFVQQFDHCVNVIEEAAAHPDPWAGFRLVVEEICTLQIHDRGFTEALLRHAAAHGEVETKSERVQAIFADVVRRAQAAGRLRPDFVPSDLSIIMLANAGIRTVPVRKAVALSQRFVAIMLRSVATNPADVTLPPGPHLELGQVLAGS